MSPGRLLGMAVEADGEVWLRRVVGAAWRRCAGPLTADLFDDCLQEGRLCLWRLEERLRGLPRDHRERYAAVAVGRHVRKFLTNERRHAQASLDCPGTEPAAALRGPDEHGRLWEAVTADDLRQCVGQEDLAAALDRLRPRDSRLLHLIFVEGRQDREVADQLGISLAAARKARQRLLARLRAALPTSPRNLPARNRGAWPPTPAGSSVPGGRRSAPS